MGASLMRGMDEVLTERGVPHVIQGFPAAFFVDFNDAAPASVRDIVAQDHTSYKAFVARLEDNGVRAHPRGVWYLSTAHNEDDVAQTLDVVRKSIG